MHALIFGGNCRIARAMAKLLLARSWTITSIIRNPQQAPRILELGEGTPGSINVLYYHLANLKTAQDAEALFNQTGATCGVFAADRDAAKSAIAAATTLDTVSKFLMISFPASRRSPAPLWGAKDIEDYNAERNSYPEIGDAKIQADEYLVAMANARHMSGGGGFQAISLRPIWLTAGAGTGKVQLGKTRAPGTVAIEDVAAVAVEMLSRDDVSGWFDLLSGEAGVEEAVEGVFREVVDCIEGEDVEAMYKLAG
ncbi:hypothetical protein BJX63DRAFT_423154 [Aspergillus granulosus]|uniref:NAD(P)-binding domain-containing protein n=1 Tax=Aspergillus granulosus TaxID=176169 RepID=A0ABR4H4D1_9EURO